MRPLPCNRQPQPHHFRHRHDVVFTGRTRPEPQSPEILPRQSVSTLTRAMHHRALPRTTRARMPCLCTHLAMANTFHTLSTRARTPNIASADIYVRVCGYSPTKSELKKAYMKALLLLHPDKVPKDAGWLLRSYI